jgi:hypothetical protein
MGYYNVGGVRPAVRVNLSSIISEENCPHKWDEGTITKIPTLAEDGQITYTCTVCGGTKNSSISKNDFEMFFKPGDVDGNGKIEAYDARLALRASVELEVYEKGSRQFMAADVIRDNVITAADARMILRACVGLENAAEWKIN